MRNGLKMDVNVKQIVTAWEQLSPKKSFGSLTLAQFKTATQPVFDTRDEVSRLQAQLAAAMDARDKADVEANAVLARVVAGVKADPEAGEDCDLYEAMGYVRKSERKSGLHRGNGQPTPPVAKAA